MSDPDLHSYEDSDHLDISETDPTQGLVDSITQGTQSVTPERGHEAEAMNEEQRQASAQVKQEQEYQTQQDREVSRVSTNYSRQVNLRTYNLIPGVAVRILDDKPMRGDAVITVVAGGPIAISREASPVIRGLNTVAIVGSRTIRTSEELYAITDVAATVIDIQEEFD